MRDRGTFNFSGNLEVKKDAPLEARSLVNSYADLVKPETWTDEQGGIWKYDCMLVSCKDRPGKVYQLSPGADYTKESSWILIGGTSELNNKVQEFIDSKGAPNGLASLNESGIIPSAQLPSYVDDVIEVDTFSNLPGTGESGKIYIVQDTNLTYRWSGTGYVEISKSLALGETSSTAYPGDKGKATTDKLNRIPDKLITDTVNVNQSTTEAVLNFTTYRQEAQQVGRNTLTITSATISQAGLMSSSDKTKLDGLKDQAGITSDIDVVQTNLETHINNKSNPHEVTKDQVGLGNVDNTSDINKPVSTAQQEALDAVKTELEEKINNSGNDLQDNIDKIDERVTNIEDSIAQPGGLATLDDAGKVPLEQLPSLVDDVIEVDSFEHLPEAGEVGKIYVTKDTNLLYRWTGVKYVEVSESLHLGETADTAYAGDKGKETTDKVNSHISDFNNPHKVTAEQVGLGNVDNTSDANKPISTATQTALNGKFSATDGNALKQRVDNIPELVATDITVDSDNDSVNISLDKTSIVDGTLSGTTINITSATASKAGILIPTDKSKIDKIITNGNGTKYLSDNGTYKEVSGGSESNIYVFSPTISGNGISKQDYDNFKEAANEGKVILVPNTLHDRKISGQFVPINYYGTSTFILSYIRPLEEADGTLVSDLCMVYIYNTYEIGGTAVRITNAKNLIIPNVNTILRPVSLQGQDAQSKINELFSSAGNFKDVVEDILVNHTRYYFHFDNKLTNCIELGCVNAWRNDARTSYELHFIVVYNANNTYYTSKVSVIYNTDINNTKYHVTNLIQSDNVSSAYVLDKHRNNRKVVSLIGEGFDENHWYPVSFSADPNTIVPPCNLIIWNSLNGDSQNEFKPSWATNNGGFTLHVDMSIIGSGQGQYANAKNKLNNYDGEWGGETAVGEMRQTAQTSTFYIYLRGGARYYYTSDYGELEMTAHSSEVSDGYNTYSIKDTQGDIKDFFTYVENDLFEEVKNLQIVHDNEFNFASNSIGQYVWINYRSRYDAVTSAKAIYIGNGQAGADGAYGAVHASGFFKESDIRLKSNIAPLKHTLDQICNIPTVEFNMHDKHQIGTIAQDLENNFAEVVNTDSDGMKSVDYCMLGVVAIEGIKLLKQEVEDLKKQIEELKNGK